MARAAAASTTGTPIATANSVVTICWSSERKSVDGIGSVGVDRDGGGDNDETVRGGGGGRATAISGSFSMMSYKE